MIARWLGPTVDRWATPYNNTDRSTAAGLEEEQGSYADLRVSLRTVRGVL
jgi:hypothetical protein